MAKLIPMKTTTIDKTINTGITRAFEIMSHDSGCNGIPQYVEHLSWLFFLKFLDERVTALKSGERRGNGLYKNYLSDEYRWSNWAPKILAERDTIQRRETYPADDSGILFVRERLFPYLASLSGGPELEMISQIFSGHTPPMCSSPDNFRKLLSIVDSLGDPDAADDYLIHTVYANLVSKLRPSDRGTAGYYTPDAVVKFMVEVVSPAVGETVFDPACGTGEFLIAAYEHLKTGAVGTEDGLLIQRSIKGREAASLPLRLCYIQALLKGLSHFNIICDDALESLEDESEQYDIILTNPPFGKSRLPPPQGEVRGQLEDEAVKSVMRKLRRREGARCGIIVSEGFLFRGDKTAATRRQLLDEYNLFMLIKLPAGAFAPHSSVSASILFFGWPGPTKGVLYHRPSPQGGPRVGGSKLNLEKHFSDTLKMIGAWESYRRGEGVAPDQTGTTWFEPIARIKERDYSLMAHPPDSMPCEQQADPSEVMHSLLEQARRLYSILDRLQMSVGSKDG